MAIKVYTGTVSVDESAGAGTETLIKRIAALGSGFRQRISSIWLDCTNSTVGGTARIKIDLGAAGATQRTIADYDLAFIAGESINLLKDGPFEADTDIEVYVATAGGGAARDFYYRIPYDDSIEKVQSVFNGSGATDDVDLSMRSLGVANDTGDAVQFVSTTAYGLYCDGLTAGIVGRGGNGGYGGLFDCAGEANGTGLSVLGVGSGHAAEFIPGVTGDGLHVHGGATSGKAASFITVNGHAVYAYAGGAANAAIMAAAGDGYGIWGYGTAGGIRGEASAGNSNGMAGIGFGAGHGLSLVAGATGNAANLVTTNGRGIFIDANGANGDAISLDSTQRGLFITALQTAIDIDAQGQGVDIDSTGVAMAIDSGSTYGLDISGSSSGARIRGTSVNANAVALTGAGSWDTLSISAPGTGRAIYAGAAGNNAVEFAATGGNNNALKLAGFGTGSGAYVVSGAGATGNALTLLSLATNGNAALFTGAGTGHGFSMVKGGGAGSKDIDADEISSIVSSVALMPTTTGLEGAFKMIGGQHKPSYKDLTYIV